MCQHIEMEVTILISLFSQTSHQKAYKLRIDNHYQELSALRGDTHHRMKNHI